jgi:hypothetical protein
LSKLFSVNPLGEIKTYFSAHYQVYHGTADLYAYFIEKGISLLRDGGFFSYIVANKWMRANYGMPLRRWLKGQHIERIIDFGDLPVFQEATTYPCIILISKRPPDTSFNATQVKTLDFPKLTKYVNENSYNVDQTRLKDEGWSLADTHAQDLMDKLQKQSISLGEYVSGKIYYGIKTGLTEAFVIDEEIRNKLITEDPKSSGIIKPFLAGRDVKKYQPPVSDKYVITFPKGWTREMSGGTGDAFTWFKENYPAITKHMEPFAEKAKKRCDQGEYWWELRACDYYAEFEKSKIIFPDISLKGAFTLDEIGGIYSSNTTYIIGSSDKYLLGILNSALMNLCYKELTAVYRGGYLRFFTQYVSKLPIHAINFSDPQDKAHHDQMVSLVEQMLDLNKQKQSEAQNFLKWLAGEIGANIEGLSGASKLQDYYNLGFSEFHALLVKNKSKLKEGYDPKRRGPKEILEAEFNDSVAKIRMLTAKAEETDRQIDALVYQLYDLTEEEIKIVESGS